MKKEQLIKKFTSRKFLLTLVVNIAAIVAIIVGDSVIVNAVAGLVMAAITAVYCIIEGNIDAKSLKQMTDAAANAAGAFGADDKTIDKIEKVGEAVGTLIGDAKAPDGTEEQE